MSFTRLPGPRPRQVELPPTPQQERAWLKWMLEGRWGAAKRVLVALKCGKVKGCKYLASAELNRFHEDEAETNRMGVTERGTDERGILYCRLTPFGEALATIFMSHQGQRKNREARRRDDETRIQDAILER